MPFSQVTCLICRLQRIKPFSGNMKSNPNSHPLGYWAAIAIGVGGMVGGGIFAVLGLTIQLAHSGAPLAFIISGIVALLTAYSYIHLSITYPSQGGTVVFLNKAFGMGNLSGWLNILLCLSYVIMLSLYAYAFGSYGATFFSPALQPVFKHFLISAIIISLTAVNIIGAKVVGRTEISIVALKIAILVFFIIVGLLYTDFSELQPAHWPPLIHVVSGGMIIFLAYEGFELIANTAQDVVSPKKILPHAFYTAVTFVIFLYVMIAIVTLGTLKLPDIIASRDYVLAASAKPFLGNAGFTLIAIAALLATASAINATLYGTSRTMHKLAVNRQLPAFLQTRKWDQPVESLLVLAGLTLIIANSFDLSMIATMGSAGFLLVFTAVNFANFRLYDQTQSSRFISLLGTIACFLSFSVLTAETFMLSPYKVLTLLVLLLVSFCLQAVCRYLNA